MCLTMPSGPGCKSGAGESSGTKSTSGSSGSNASPLRRAVSRSSPFRASHHQAVPAGRFRGFLTEHLEEVCIELWVSPEVLYAMRAWAVARRTKRGAEVTQPAN